MFLRNKYPLSHGAPKYTVSKIIICSLFFIIYYLINKAGRRTRPLQFNVPTAQIMP